MRIAYCGTSQCEYRQRDTAGAPGPARLAVSPTPDVMLKRAADPGSVYLHAAAGDGSEHALPDSKEWHSQTTNRTDSWSSNRGEPHAV
ncbi:hypothetical protein AAFF_G00291100 [Aldrovandia affinis]|uniref:Uncharacterized protein n=1 Tax=Aldrovandia affinis TaxID=143900 RepID=A0AAD7R9Z4_9TELE|nr:hypothetical protein AAFF_G00291100 [Aldrovandia affinis]